MDMGLLKVGVNVDIKRTDGKIEHSYAIIMILIIDYDNQTMYKLNKAWDDSLAAHWFL